MITNMIEARDLTRQTLEIVVSKLKFKYPSHKNDMGDLALWISKFETFIKKSCQRSFNATLRKLAESGLITKVLDAIIQIVPILSCDPQHIHALDPFGDGPECPVSKSRLAFTPFLAPTRHKRGFLCLLATTSAPHQQSPCARVWRPSFCDLGPRNENVAPRPSQAHTYVAKEQIYLGELD
ncbi:hypothetical protein DL93DRAFT_135860 [Clavulina sp. PMI_390]|nr:hypothetical protein DL93DRAFT_135860 [Clavulina sp. PMI_390]